MEFKDQSERVIKDGDALLFSVEDSLEPSGYGRFVTDVKLCCWCANEKRYIPLSEHTTENGLTGVDIIQDHTHPNTKNNND